MMNKYKFYISIIILILLITFLIWFAYIRTDYFTIVKPNSPKKKIIIESKNVKTPSKNLYPIEQKLQKLKDDLSILIQHSATGDQKRVKMFFNTLIATPNIIISSLSQLPDKTLIYFNLDGSTIQEPVLKMSQKPELFKELAKSGLLRFLGNVVAIATWCSESKNKTSPGFEKFSQCLDKINWNDVANWKEIDKLIEKCI
jgi:hypothetical protein